MKKYKGYLLDNWSYTFEETESSGTSSQKAEGTGRYITATGYKIIDIKSGKSIIHKGSLDDAKHEIDKLTNPVFRKEARKAKSTIKRAKNETKAIEEAVRKKKQLLDERVRTARLKEEEIENRLSSKLFKEFY